ncbi:MAG: phosphoribosylaminoimidazolesuccinocarboxamide synthase [Tissierella sp.]|uniref:phosphoribosylaminoimidazolesuccinocarboxamide synthase n=1 Tax=Tissierella sp. TaxID=41274 RepID=UPI003F9C11D8
MKLLYKGKTKDVYELDENKVLLKFKDDVTGKDGKFDPGANEVGLSIDGIGKSGLKLTKYFFEKLNDLDIPTHYIEADIEKSSMTVLKADFFGEGVEVICRYRAVGSFIRRYGLYAKEGDELDSYVEFTLKDDERGDPLITQEGLDILGIMKLEEYEKIEKLTRDICNVIKEELLKEGLELYDIKLEFGRVGDDKHIALIDEISGGSMRVYRGEEYIEPLELERMFLNK